jgi:hypothetical protein
MAKIQMNICYIRAGGNVGTLLLSGGPNNTNHILENKQKQS